MGGLYESGACACEAGRSNRRPISHAAPAFERVVEEGVTVGVKDASGRERYTARAKVPWAWIAGGLGAVAVLIVSARLIRNRRRRKRGGR